MVLLLLCSVLSALAEERTYAAVPVAVLAGGALLLDRVEAVRRHPVVAGVVEAATAGLAVGLTGGAGSPMLPYLLAPGLGLGLTGTSWDVVRASGAAVAGLTAGRLLGGSLAVVPTGPLRQDALTAGQWLAIGLGLGLVAVWAQRLVAADPLPGPDRYAEARGLLQQLRAVTRRLPGGLDVTSAAESLLTDCATVARSVRSAVLVQPAPGQLVPVAVRGTRRLPYRAPLDEPGPLREAWDSASPVVDRRSPDVQGRRGGSALVVLPLLHEAEPFGLVVLESFDAEAYDEEQVAALQGRVDDAALRLETAMLFDEVRHTVTLEERDRLAREMHDGVAQEVAFVGYQLDDLRLRAAKVDEGLAASIAEVRSGLTHLVSDIRLSITDLRTSLSSDRALGAAITGYLRAVGSGRGLVVHLSLQESAFRLPGEHEVLLFQVVQAVAQEVRRKGTAKNLWVTLDVDPPSAEVVVEHDGRDGDRLELGAFEEQLARADGALHVEHRPEGGVRVAAVLGGGTR